MGGAGCCAIASWRRAGGFHSKGLKHLKTVLSRKVPELILALFVSAILLLVSSTLIYAIEGSEYPDFDSISKALYWSAMTVTTVGYGDVVPKTLAGASERDDFAPCRRANAHLTGSPCRRHGRRRGPWRNLLHS